MVKRESLGDRRAAILRAIVSHYVRSGDPVGSKTLVDRYRLGVSPATVRNEMGALEDGGYIYQPHTSAGRVPTDAGYRYYVDSTRDRVKLPAHDAQRVRRFFVEPRFELEDALRQSASLLSDITDHAAVVFAPALDRSVVRHLEIVPLSGERAMVVVVTNTGRVDNQIIGLPGAPDSVHLAQAAEMLNRMVVDQPLDRAARTIETSLERFPLELRAIAGEVARAVKQGFAQHEAQRVYLEGTSTIVDESKFADLETVRQVIEALEHRRVLLEVLADALSIDEVSVRIGSENMLEEMQACSVIAAPYGTGEGSLGTVGIVGPTRMDYGRTIAAVHEVASQLGKLLAQLGL